MTPLYHLTMSGPNGQGETLSGSSRIGGMPWSEVVEAFQEAVAMEALYNTADWVLTYRVVRYGAVRYG